MKRIFTLVSIAIFMVAGLFNTVSAESEPSIRSTLSSINFENAYTVEAGETVTGKISSRYYEPRVYKVMFPFSGEGGFRIQSIDANFRMAIFDENHRELAYLESDDDIILEVDGGSWYYMVVWTSLPTSYGAEFQLMTGY